MTILGSIMSSIFGGQAAPPPAPPSAQPSGERGETARSAAVVAPTPQPQPPRPASPAPGRGQVDIAAVLNKLAEETDQNLDWRRSIVDLMKLLKLDSSLSARRKLARELSYAGDTKDSAAMNVWLHRQVMRKLSEHGGNVPPELRH